MSALLYQDKRATTIASFSSSPFLFLCNFKHLFGVFYVFTCTPTRSPIPHTYWAAGKHQLTQWVDTAHAAKLSYTWWRADPLNLNLKNRLILLQGVLTISKMVFHRAVNVFSTNVWTKNPHLGLRGHLEEEGAIGQHSQVRHCSLMSHPNAPGH